MMLAAITNYLYIWQLPMIAGFLVLWLAGGPFLVRRALRRLGELPRAEQSLSYAAKINFFANGTGLLALLIVTGFLGVLATRVGPPSLLRLAIPIAPAAMYLMSCAVHALYLDTPARVIFRVALTSTGVLIVTGMALAAAALAPAWFIRQSQARFGLCERNIGKIQTALQLYERNAAGGQAPSLEGLVTSGNLEREVITCPAKPGGAVGYLYAPCRTVRRSADSKEDSKQIRVADRRGNHGDQRLVLFADDRLVPMAENQFQELLKLPENAALAKAAAADK